MARCEKRVLTELGVPHVVLDNGRAEFQHLDHATGLEALSSPLRLPIVAQRMNQGCRDEGQEG